MGLATLLSRWTCVTTQDGRSWWRRLPMRGLQIRRCCGGATAVQHLQPCLPHLLTPDSSSHMSHKQRVLPVVWLLVQVSLPQDKMPKCVYHCRWFITLMQPFVACQICLFVQLGIVFCCQTNTVNLFKIQQRLVAAKMLAWALRSCPPFWSSCEATLPPSSSTARRSMPPPQSNTTSTTSVVGLWWKQSPCCAEGRERNYRLASQREGRERMKKGIWMTCGPIG